MPPISQDTKDRLRASFKEEVKAEVLEEIQTAAAELAEEVRQEERAKLQAEFAAREAQIRAELMAQVRETGSVDGPKDYSGPEPGTYEFWALSPSHTPRLRMSDGVILKFTKGHLIVDNPVYAQAIRDNFAGQVWESNWFGPNPPPRCKVTGYQPRSIECWLAYQEWVTPQTPAWQPIP